jgi:hypothetical protein
MQPHFLLHLVLHPFVLIRRAAELPSVLENTIAVMVQAVVLTLSTHISDHEVKRT